MTTSLPEKTLEHWASQYIAYRFQSQLGQWWPAVGADIEIAAAGLPVGKAILLELKTATPTSPTSLVHEVLIDVPQLVAYLTKGTPVYYVVPHPTWPGTLGATLAGQRREELAFRRSAPSWFGSWTHVIAGWSLHAAIVRSGRSHQKTAKLGAWDEHSHVWTWGPAFAMGAGAAHPQWAWTDFWRVWEQCGSRWMPSTVVVPSASVRGMRTRRGLVERDQLMGALVGVADGDLYGDRAVFHPVYEDGQPTGRYRRQADGRDGSEAPRAGSTMLATLPATRIIQ